MMKTEEQCTCGHAADRHGLDAICNEDCYCTSYDSWITPEMELANSLRISGDNADIAVKALGELASAQERIVTLEAALRAVLPLVEETFRRHIPTCYQTGEETERSRGDWQNKHLLFKQVTAALCDHRGECTHIEAK